MDYFISEVLGHHFYLVFYGIIVYWLILWSIAKSREDSKNGNFDFRRWFKRNYDEIILTCFIGMSFIIWDDEIEELVIEGMKYDLDFKTYHYFFAGPFSDLLIKFVKLAKYLKT